MKRLLLSLLLLLAALLLFQHIRGRNSSPSVSDKEFRIVSLSPTLTENLFELGEGDWIVGVTNYCNFPAAARKKERIGDLINPDVEKITALHPNLILAERWASTKIVKRLQGMGFKVDEVSSPRSIPEVFYLIEQVGRIVGREERAREIVLDMRKRLSTIQARAGRLRTHPRVYVEIDLPTWTVGRLSYTHEALSMCGAHNIFEDVGKPALLASQEAIIQRDPEIILSFTTPAREIASRPGWASISAVRENKIIDHLDRDLLSRGSFRLVQGMEEFQTQMELLLNRNASVFPGGLSSARPHTEVSFQGFAELSPPSDIGNWGNNLDR